MFAPLFQRWIKLCYQQGTKIVTPSFYARSLLKQYGIEKKIHVISNGIAFQNTRKIRRQDSGFGNNTDTNRRIR